MSNIQIICTSPGLRRNGIEHPASAVYPANRWSETEIAAFRRDPAFVVQEVAAGGVKLSGDDFDIAVAAEVKKQVETIREGLQVTFNLAVTTAVDERLSSIKADHDNALDTLGKQLQTANDRIAELQAAALPPVVPVVPEPPAEPASDDVAEPVKKATAKK